MIEEKQKELEFINGMLSERLTPAHRCRFGASSEIYAEEYEWLKLFNEVEAALDEEEVSEKIGVDSNKRKKHTGKKVFPDWR